MSEQAKTSDLSPAEVAAYLKNNPEFFLKFESLLGDMQLPQSSGSAVSLVERQVSILRQEASDAKARLDEYVESARKNNEIFDKSRNLILGMMEADNADQFFAALETSFRDDFQSSAYHLIVFSDTPHQINHFSTTVSEMAAKDYIGGLLRAKQPTLGVLRQSEQDFLFRHQSSQVRSAAVLSVRKNRQIAMLALGSEDVNYFQPGMGTLFLGFIADALAKLLPRFIYLKHQ